MIRLMLQFDTALLVQAQRMQHPWVTRLMQLCTRAGDTHSWFVLLAVLVLWQLPQASTGVFMAAAAIHATLWAQTLKRTCRRSRPNRKVIGLKLLTKNPDEFSFPSGHTTTAFAVASALAAIGSPLAYGFGLFALLLGASRVYLGAHYPLDVAAGAALGAMTGISAAMGLSSFLSW